MENNNTLLQGSTDAEKGAYLTVITSLATADRQASGEELEYIETLSETANLSPEQAEGVRRAATEISDEDLTRSLDVLKNSELKYSLVTDLIAFAKSDANYSDAEKQNVQKIAEYLQVDQQQFSLLEEVSQQAAATHPEELQDNPQGFLSGGGLREKLQGAGINSGGLFKGLLGMAGPFILASLFKRGIGSKLGGGLGSLSGGGGMAGGLGSLLSMLGGGRGMSGAGGMLGRIFKGGF